MHKIRKIGKTLVFGALMAVALQVSSAFSAETSDPPAEITISRDDPQEMLQTATDQVLKIVEETKQETNRDSQAFYKRIDDVLSQIVDLEYFARGVMATHASARRYKALTTDEERAAFRERITRFSDVLKDSLMSSYADALLTFDGERITWEPAPKESQGDNLTLTQIIHAKSNKQYKAQYRLKKTKDGWLIQNVIVEGLNLGEAYRNQFADAVEKNKGNVDYVVENWPKLMSRVAPETK
jgi:phospholipid transport system substrate-binding protein